MMLLGLRFEWKGYTASSISTIYESDRNADPQALLQTYWLRICPLTRAPGAEKQQSRAVIPTAQATPEATSDSSRIHVGLFPLPTEVYHLAVSTPGDSDGYQV